jgi:hypothetical protein
MKDDLTQWFNNYFQNCYNVKHNDYPESIFMYYDLRYVRKMKICKIEGKQCLQPNKITGKCIFVLDWKNNCLWCNYDDIWNYIENNYSYNYYDVQNFIKNRLEENSINVLTPKFQCIIWTKTSILEEYSKMNVLF